MTGPPMAPNRRRNTHLEAFLARALPVLPKVARGTGNKSSNDRGRLRSFASVASTFPKNKKIEEIGDREGLRKSVATLARRPRWHEPASDSAQHATQSPNGKHVSRDTPPTKHAQYTQPPARRHVNRPNFELSGIQVRL